MNKRLTGKVALVTGAASGIGQAIASLFAREGAKVVIADVDEAGANRVAQELKGEGCEVSGCRLDVTNEQDWTEAIGEHVLRASGRFDVLVNNAGVASSGAIADLNLGEWQRTLSVNLDGVVLGMKHAFRAMPNGGSIINVASVSGMKPFANCAAYGASKAAVIFLSRVAALEGAARDIRVNCISPGAVATPMWRSVDWFDALQQEKGSEDAALAALVAEKGFTSPMQIAKTALFLASDDSAALAGVNIPIDNEFSP